MEYKSVEAYAKILRKLLDAEYVGYASSTQLKMGVTTLDLLVKALEKK